jgi:hypothetical protein
MFFLGIVLSVFMSLTGSTNGDAGSLPGHAFTAPLPGDAGSLPGKYSTMDAGSLPG